MLFKISDAECATLWSEHYPAPRHRPTNVGFNAQSLVGMVLRWNLIETSCLEVEPLRSDYTGLGQQTEVYSLDSGGTAGTTQMWTRMLDPSCLVTTVLLQDLAGEEHL